MSDRTHISWSDATWNVVTGCTRVSPGCLNCYIERTPPFRMTGRRFDRPGIGATTGVRLHPERIDQPLRWKKPRRVFVCSLADLFHHDVPADYIARVFAVMALTRRHTFQVLTKRHGPMRSLLTHPNFRHQVSEEATDMMASRAWQRWQLDLRGQRLAGDSGPAALPDADWTVTPTRNGNLWSPPWPLPNVWLGVSVGNQHWADARIPALLDTPAAVRFLSCEPLLGPVDLSAYLGPHEHTKDDSGRRGDRWITYADDLHWVIVGGESGPNARPMQPEWISDLRDQCACADVAFHFKQAGSVLARQRGAHGNGSDPSYWPETFPRDYPTQHPEGYPA